MTTIPTLTERDIRNFVTEQNLLKGQSYVREGAVFETRRHGTTLRASCKGSQGEVYKVRVTFEDKDKDIADSLCTCPAGNHGYCKHIAALLWAWHENPVSFIEIDKAEVALMDLDKPELISLMKQMLQLHPDLEGLIEKLPPPTTGTAATGTGPKQKRVPFNPELYQLQVNEIFRTVDRNKWGSEGRAAEPLMRIKAIADDYVQEHNYADATAIYEIIIRGIMNEYDSFRWHADEGDLDGVVRVCIDELATCLKEERDDQNVRQQIVRLLYDVFAFDEDLYNDEPVMSGRVPSLLVRYTTSEERRMIAGWIRKDFQLDVNWHTDDVSNKYDRSLILLLGLEADTIDDETFLRLCAETESYDYLVERLLKLGRLDEALQEAEQVEDYEILEIADILSQHGYDDVAEKIIQARTKKHDDTDLLRWLKARYQARGDYAAALDAAKRILRAYPFLATLENYREIRQFAQRLACWETERTELLAFLEGSDQTISLRIRIALEEDEIDKALALLQSRGKQSSNSYEGPYGSVSQEVAIDVARATEATHPLASIEIYKRYIERLIERRGRDLYRMACQYLLSVRDIYQRMGKVDEWMSYITDLRERNKNLPALKDEMAKAKL